VFHPLSMILIIFFASLMAGWVNKRFPVTSHWLLALIPALVTARVFFSDKTLPPIVGFDWLPELGLTFSFRLDGLAGLFTLVITLIGTFILLYGGAYFKDHAKKGFFLTWTLFFMASMVGVVTSENIFLLFVFWEFTSLSSYLLIGINHEQESSRFAAQQALLVTGAGGLFLLAGLIMLSLITGSTDLTSILAFENIQDHTLFYPMFIAIALGAFTKSAQVPFHFWLPGAMAAPTPISAYLHSATMVKAGVYLLARFFPLFSQTPIWTPMCGIVGGLTFLVGTLMAIGPTDLKRILDYSTMAMLGALILMLGVGNEIAITAMLVFFVAHALYKATLFMVVGIIDKFAKTRDIRELSGMRSLLPLPFIAAILAGLSKAGMIPLLGFIGKELFYKSVLKDDIFWPLVLTAFIGNSLLVYISANVVLVPFTGLKKYRSRANLSGGWLPGILTLGTLSFALWILAPWFYKSLINPAVLAMNPQWQGYKLALWYGVDGAFGLSVLTMITGIVLFVFRNRLTHVATAFAGFKSFAPSVLFARGLDALVPVCQRITRLFQTQSLVHYLAWVFITAFILLLSQIFITGGIDMPELAAGFVEWVLFFIIVLSTILVIRSSSRFTIVVGLGVIGYTIALLFLVYGAPDLALTQVLVETVTVLLFVLVLYRLPRIRQEKNSHRIAKSIVAVFSGLSMTLLILEANSVPIHDTISNYMVLNSYILAQGRNVVNVILVDYRALDTFMEITVLAIAALGIMALVKTRSTGVIVSPILRTSARLLVPLILLVSLYIFYRGHHQPGGGFIGGLLAALVVVYFSLAYPVEDARRLVRFDPVTMIVLGLSIALLSGLIALLFQSPFMTGYWIELEWVGGLKLGTPLLFDLGVYITVIGVILLQFFQLQEEE
jgi:multicomponent Na+:H+ antiporter subunit A